MNRDGGVEMTSHKSLHKGKQLIGRNKVCMSSGEGESGTSWKEKEKD